MSIPKELLDKTPLFKEEWLPMFNKLRENEFAPKWNTSIGDRLEKDDIIFINNFNSILLERRKIQNSYPSELVIRQILKNRDNVIWYQKNLQGIDLEKDFFKIKFMERKDLQNNNLVNIIPLDIDIGRMVLNPTSGTSGSIIYCPNHPKSVGCYDPLIQYALLKHGIDVKYDFNTVAAIQLCFQENTITYPTVHSYLNGAGFAKINLNSKEWRSDNHPDKYINEMSPVFFSGDPFAFYQAAIMGISYKPQILYSTAISMEDRIYDTIKSHFKIPIVDVYSTNETGPIAYSCPLNKNHYHIISPDIFIETIDSNENHFKNGEFGELVFTGGRNPFLPLLRYK
ncbi:MAG TPA: phenylacetate--CoA ligase family protein, partial [Spirochaetota bacterium]|nr:phenylacetate--CoA ligase family protein [Spirochaetota bacterium]